MSIIGFVETSNTRQKGQKMNALDDLIKELTYYHCDDLRLSPKLTNQMIKEISICVDRGYNTRAEIISLLKKAIA
jgi:hypothetical protein